MKRSIICGIPIDDITMNETLRWILHAIRKGKSSYIVTPNLDFAEQCSWNTELLRILLRADLVVCDGTPLVWLSKVLGTPLRERVPGSDLVPRLLVELECEGMRVFFLGGDENSLLHAVKAVKENHPNLKFDYYSPPFSPIQDLLDNQHLAKRIMDFKPDVLLVGFGCPKQEYFIASKHRELGVPVSIGIGGTINFLAGTHYRAPRWIGLLGLEWVVRLFQEPMRLFPRYYGNLVFLIRQLVRQITSSWTWLPHSLPPPPPSEIRQVLCWKGELCQGGTGDFPDPPPNTPFLLDCSGVTKMDPEGLARIVLKMEEASQAGVIHGITRPPEWMVLTLHANMLDRIVPIYHPPEGDDSLRTSPSVKRNGIIIESAVSVITAAWIIFGGNGSGSSDESFLSLGTFVLILYLVRPVRLVSPKHELSIQRLLPAIITFCSGAIMGSVLLQSIGWVWGVGYLASRRIQSAGMSLERILATMFLSLPWLIRDFPSIGWWFRVSGAVITETFYRTMGYHVVRTGTEMTVGALPVLIEPGCAGLGLLQSLLATGSLLLALYFPKNRVYYALLPLIPLFSWMANTTRIVIITGIALAFGSRFASGVFHTCGGLLVIFLMVLLCLLPLEAYRKIQGKR